MEIRRLTPADADAFASPLCRILSQLRGAGTTLNALTLRAILSNADVYVFGAFVDGTLAGTLTLTTLHLLSGIRSRIEDVVVDHAYRRQGIAAALVKHALQIARARGAITLDLTTEPSRVAANSLYRDVGFAIRETNVYRYYPQDSRERL